MKAQRQPAARIQTIHGQPSWRLASSHIEAFITRRGGHLGPVSFKVSGRKIQPFSIAPWWLKPDPKLAPILQILRGDFFCLPFGGNGAAYRQERHPVHGETANAAWKFESLLKQQGTQCLQLSLRTKVRAGRVEKVIAVVEGHDVVYNRHCIAGARGPMCLGHHAMLAFPDREGSGLLSCSPWVYGQVFPEAFEKPEQGGYNSLKPGAEFSSLEQVPLLNGGIADLSRYPARRGFEDLVMLVSDPKLPFAWTAVAFPRERYVWFALKNPATLRNTVLWISNGGRHYAPWNGRHVNVLGLEEVTANFHYGLAESVRPNPISRRGYPTCVMLDPRRPLVVPYIMGVVAIPSGFDRVTSIEPDGKGIVLVAASGRQTRARVALDFITAGNLPAPAL